MLLLLKLWLKIHPLLQVSFEFPDDENILVHISEGTSELTTVTLTPELQRRLVALGEDKKT